MFVAKAVSFLTLIAFALAKGHSKLCLKCEHLTDPGQCNVYHLCNQHDHSCFTEVRVDHGNFVYELDCRPNHDCHDVSNDILGKRAAHGQVACRHCCHTTACNAHLCGSYVATMTTPNTTATTNPTATTVPAQAKNTTLPADACQDFENDHFKCSNYDKFHLCDAVSGLSYELGHKNCQLHCGFCQAGGKLQDACQDHEDANFRCVNYDNYNLCTAAAGSLEYELGQKRCQKHCGFCTSGQALTNANTTSAPSTAATNLPATPATNPPQDTTSWAPVGVDVTVSRAQTTQSACQDYETPNFSCTEWATHGFCQASTGQGYEIAKMRCAKYCGFCH